MHSAAIAAALAVALLVLPAPPAAADWLVTRDGERIETAGPWEIKGKLAVFSLAGGGLASMRVAELDLEASARATAEAARRQAAPPPPPAPPPRKEPVLVLTDDDVLHVQPDRSPRPEEAQEAKTAKAPRPAPAERLKVLDWDQAEMPEGGGLRISGSLRNMSREVTGNIQLTVLAFGIDGSLVATTAAQLSARTLTPGQNALFEADLPGVFGVSAVRFETTMVALKSGEEDESGGEAPAAGNLET